jgi:hypothetical protein
MDEQSKEIMYLLAEKTVDLQRLSEALKPESAIRSYLGMLEDIYGTETVYQVISEDYGEEIYNEWREDRAPRG